jgi:nucleotide-binding universal stress UspA family protein
MAAHRESFFRELFGRISDRVARDSRHMVVLVETPHRAATIPRRPSKILIPILSEAYDASPYIIASALTSTATTPDSELVVARVVQLPPTTPLDAMEVSKTLKMLEKSFSYYVANSIQSLGRLFTPRILPVREVGRDVAAYVQDIEADAIVLWSDKPAGFRKLLPREAYDIVAKAPCVVLVVFHKKR